MPLIPTAATGSGVAVTSARRKFYFHFPCRFFLPHDYQFSPFHCVSPPLNVVLGIKIQIILIDRIKYIFFRFIIAYWKGKILIKDRIADSMFQQVLTRPDEYEVIATPNLNGDYLSDACAAQVGGLGMAPGANIGDYIGLFEATHGTAPKYADKDVINPGSLILSASMMLEYLGWDKAAEMVKKAMQKTISKKTVTYDLHRQMKGAKKVGTTEYANQIIKNMK